MNYIAQLHQRLRVAWLVLAAWPLLFAAGAQAQGPCGAGTISVLPYFQNFDLEINGPTVCSAPNPLATPGWVNAGMDMKDWTPRDIATPTGGTGPAGDHTGGGHYLYLEASGCFSHNAFLESPCFDFAYVDHPQISFWYHMDGGAMGTLHLQVSIDSGLTWSPPIWALSGPQGPAWTEAIVDLTAYAGMNVKLRFEGITGPGDHSDMAIDDVSLFEKPCAVVVNSFPYHTGFDSEITGGTNCSDTLNLVEPGWINVLMDQKDWTTRSAGTPTLFTGPTADVSGSGHYLYLEATSCASKNAHLISPCFDLSAVAAPQLKFQYHMWGMAMGSMQVRVSTNMGAVWSAPVWSLSGNQGNGWQQAVVDLSAYYGQTVVFRFEGVTGSGNLSDMALDEVEVLSGIPPVVSTDSLAYLHADLSAMHDGRLRIQKRSPAYLNVCDEQIDEAFLVARLTSGNDYRFGANAFTAAVEVEFEALDGTGATVTTLTPDTLTIHQDQPEQWYRTDITSIYNSTDSIDITIKYFDPGSYAPLADSLRLEVLLVRTYKIGAFHATSSGIRLVNGQTTVNASPVDFSWNCNCEFPLYQFQLLRLRNEAQANAYNEQAVATTVDWSQALTLETPKKSVRLTPTEGQGFYAWRVRPIANEHDGLIADDRNYGKWSSSPPDGASVSYTTPTGVSNIFFYTDPNDTINRVVGRNYSGDTQILEFGNFYNQLLQEEQQQRLLHSQEEVIADQSVYDFSNRAALKTIAAPIGQNYLGYDPDFLEDEHGNVYSAENFDDDANYDDPDSAFGAPGAYYSGSNPDLSVPDAEGFPFARVHFFNDGTDRTKEQSVAGAPFRIGGGKTDRVYFTGVEDSELTRIFGDEAPKSASVHKIIEIDPNKVSTVTYMTKSGQVLATCQSRNTAQVSMDTLSYAEIFTVSDTISNSFYYSDYGLQSIKSLVLVEPTTILIDYSIDPKRIEALCGRFCATCDYTVYLFVHHLDDTASTTVDTLTLDGADCLTGGYDSMHLSYSLDPGRYTIEKRLFANNVMPGSVTATNTLGTTYLEYYTSMVQDSLDSTYSEYLDLIYEYLDSADIDGLYDYLDANADENQGDTLFRVYAECDTFEIPVVPCDEYDCSTDWPGFEAYYLASVHELATEAQASYSSSTIEYSLCGELISGMTYGNLWYVTDQYDTGQVDSLVHNMLVDPDVEYTCEELWQCWEAVIQTAVSDFLYYEQYGDGERYDAVKKFLECTGKYYRGVTTQAWTTEEDPTIDHGYRSHAYAYFYYADGAHGHCESTLGYDSSSPWDADTDEAPSGDPLDYDYDPYENRPWEAFYNCVYLSDTSADMSADEYLSEILDACSTACEARREIFAEEVSELYASKGLSLSAPELDCLVGMLVDHCEKNCDVTIFYTGGSTTGTDGLHYAPGALDSGSYYRIEPINMDAAVELNYNDDYFGVYMLNGTDFLAGNNPDYTYTSGYTDGIDFRVTKIITEYDSIGTRAEIQKITEAMTYPFELALPNSPGGCDGGFDFVKDTTRLPGYPNLIANGDFSHSTSCGSLPDNLGYCEYNWNNAFGMPLTDTTIDAGYSPRMANFWSWYDTTGKVIRGDGAYLEQFSGLQVDSAYTLTFNLMSPTNQTADNIYVLLDDGSKTGFPLTHNRTPLPRPGAQVIYHGKRVRERAWDYYEIHFIYTDPNNTQFAIYPRQEYGSDTTYFVIDNVTLTPTKFEVCDSICFRWVPPVIEVDSTTFVFEPNDCDEETAEYLDRLLENQETEFIEDHLDALATDYTDSCLTAEAIDDTLVVGYEVGYYHYTLYFYDRAGNLVKTVSPKGVDKDDAHTRLDHPAHGFETVYEYNSQGQRVRRQTPDGGEMHFGYNAVGQLRITQDAQQASDGHYTYYLYDELSRTIESGTSDQDVANAFDDANLDDPAFPTTGWDKVETVYSEAASGITYYGTPQAHLYNRVSSTTTDAGVATYYSYDPHGNVEWIVQELPGLGKSYVYFHYDIVTNGLTGYRFNEQGEDAFFARINYNEDGQITGLESSRDGIIWDRDVRMSYDPTGRLQRTLVGEDSLQGIDYAYTLLGWLKAINHPDLDVTNDPGADGQSLTGTAPDAFGAALGYFEGDFVHSGSPFENGMSTHLPVVDDLHNGQVAAWASQLRHASGGQYEQLTGHTYRYDELGRLTRSRFNVHSSGTWSSTDEFGSSYAYDPNSNITALNRNAYGANPEMDSLTYDYGSGTTNLLDHVSDIVSTASYGDLSSQSSGNYSYDANGRLTSDATEGITAITWNDRDRITSIDRSGTADDLAFIYDGADRRVMKIVKPGGTSVSADWDTTYYVRGPGGETQAIYAQSGGTYTLEEMHLSAARRVGLLSPGAEIVPEALKPATEFYQREIGARRYEFADHLDNVRAVYTDRLLSYDTTGGPAPDSFAVEILAANNYFPFGMEMPQRNYSAGDYRYGFNGMEKDDEVAGEGNSYTTEFRQYDPRVARWLSIDPLAEEFPWSSPYVAFANDPILHTDPKGLAPQDDQSIGNLWESYDKDGQGIIRREGGKLTQFAGDNTCAIRMSYAMNQAGYPIPQPGELPGNIHAVTDADGESYIYSALDMEQYLLQTYGKPDIYFLKVTEDNLEEVEAALEGATGIIHLRAGNSEAYDASGHVDLIGKQGPYTEMKGNGFETNDYFETRIDAELTVSVWLFEEVEDEPIPDDRWIGEQAFDQLKLEWDMSVRGMEYLQNEWNEWQAERAAEAEREAAESNEGGDEGGDEGGGDE